jgi:RimJ/RimL family protein N-acetyltransferase
MLGNNLLRGEKVYLTTNTHDNDAYFADCFNDFDFATLTSFDLRMNTPETQRQRTESGHNSKDQFHFAVHILDTDQLIGVCSLVRIDWKNRGAMLGISITEQNCWGKGYGSDASNVLLRWAFYELGLHRVDLGVFAYNPRAIRAYEKLGFVHEGREREALFRDGTYHDILIMSILQHEWRARQESDA